MSFLLDLNWLGLLSGATASYLLGVVWYSPYLFGPLWRRLVKPHRNGVPLPGMVVSGLASLSLAILIATVIHTAQSLAHIIVLLQALTLVLLTLSSCLSKGNSLIPWGIDTGYRLLSIAIIVASVFFL